jgi:hypothetical protein
MLIGGDQAQASGTYQRAVGGTCTYKMVAGDTLNFAIYSDITATLDSGDNTTYFTVKQLG